MTEFHCKIDSCDKTFYDGPAVSLVIPAWDGELGFLANHEACITAVSYGVLRVTTPEGKVIPGATGLGFVRFENNEALVVLETIERPEDIDAVRARRAKEAAEEELKEARSQQEYNASQAALSRALYRLSAHGKYIHDQKYR